MVIYCDRLSFRAVVRILGLRIVGSGTEWVVSLLDEPAWGGGQRVLRRVLRLAGIPVREAGFHAGSMCSSAGERLPWVASRIAQDLAFAQARDTASGVSVLGSINARWGRRTVELHLAKRLWVPISGLVLRILVASQLSVAEHGRSIILLHRPTVVGSKRILDRFPELAIHLCGPTGNWGEWIRHLFGRISRVVFARGASDAKEPDRQPGEGDPAPSPSLASVDPNAAGLLVLQQDDLGADRSYRTQPHWLFADGDRPQFHTYVLGKSYVRRTPYDAQTLQQLGITVLGTVIPFVFQRLTKGRFELGRVVSDAALCAFGSVFRRGELRTAYRTTLGLLLHAWILGRLCRALNIRVFLSGEGFLRETDAMQLIGPPLGITTVSYQYSNLARSSVVMMTTATTLLTFSDAYEVLYSKGEIGPESMVENGYPFDSSFECLHERSATLRSRLAAAGATFVICFFDETVDPGKYGLIHPSQHRAEFEALLQKVAEDPTIGLVVKTQYLRNAPSRLYASHEQLEAVRNSGRYVEIAHGSHRNTVFPAEAALAADIAIGHVIGGTASLEAALSGRRSIMLNPYGYTGVHDQIYDQAEVVFSSVEEALEAVCAYRKGDPSHAALGDWTPILDHFDPFRDGESGHRMRRLLDELVVNSEDRPLVMDHDSTTQVSMP